MPESGQTYASHTRWDPQFHFFLFPIVAISFLLAVWNAIRNPSFNSIWLAVIGVAAIVGVLTMRMYAAKVQDRIIRLEERLRLRECLQDPLRSRIDELTERQLVAIRFASDEELPALVQKTLQNGLGAAEIKKAIVRWRPDNFRV
jgi:hypothetical protein